MGHSQHTRHQALRHVCMRAYTCIRMVCGPYAQTRLLGYGLQTLYTTNRSGLLIVGTVGML